jgi:hypothetical protein
LNFVKKNEPMKINVVMTWAEGMNLEFIVKRNLSISGIKSKIEEMNGIRTFQQCILYASQHLTVDWRTLGDYNIKDGSTIYVGLNNCPKNEPMQIFVDTPNGIRFMVKFKPNHTIDAVRSKIKTCLSQYVEGDQPDTHCLVFDGMELEIKGRTLRQYNIKEGSVIRFLHISMQIFVWRQ